MAQNVAAYFQRSGGVGFVKAQSPEHLMGTAEPPKSGHTLPDFPWQKSATDLPHIGRSMVFLKDLRAMTQRTLFSQFQGYDSRLTYPLADIDSLMKTFKDVPGMSHSVLTLLYFAGAIYCQDIINKRHWREDEEAEDALEKEAEAALESGDKDALSKVVSTVMLSEFGAKKKARQNPTMNEDVQKYVCKIVLTDDGKHIHRAVKAIIANVFRKFAQFTLYGTLTSRDNRSFGGNLIDAPDSAMLDIVDVLDKEFGILSDPLLTVLFITNINNGLVSRVIDNFTITNAAVPDGIRAKIAFQYIFSILW